MTHRKLLPTELPEEIAGLPWVPNTEPLSENWFKYRRPRITSTDVAPIMSLFTKDPAKKAHLQRFKSAYEVWARIQGADVGGAHDENAASKRGNFGEELALIYLEREHGLRLFSPPGILQSQSNPLLCASPDAAGFGPPEGGEQPPVLGEAKVPRWNTYDDWADGTPLAYRMQTETAILCAGVDTCFVAVALNDEVHVERIDRSALTDKIEKGLEIFQRVYLEGGAEPEPFEFTRDAPILSKRLGELDGKIVRLETASPAFDVFTEWRAADETARTSAKSAKALKLKLVTWLEKRKATAAILDTGDGFTWERDKNKTRSLRYKKRFDAADVAELLR